MLDASLDIPPTAAPFSWRKISLAVRKRLPKLARNVLRLGRHAVVTGRRSSAPIPSYLLTECRLCADRNELVSRLQANGCVAEVGTERGVFARHILQVASPWRLHLIDLDFSSLAADVAQDHRVVRNGGFSHEVLSNFPDDYFDWVYIDADHSFSGVLRDAEAASSKVKPGGYLVFNDFAHIDAELGTYGVHRAVSEFAVRKQWPLAFFALSTAALYDVALRKPLAGGAITCPREP
jgi:phospholipid N-methyltransferase